MKAIYFLFACMIGSFSLFSQTPDTQRDGKDSSFHHQYYRQHYQRMGRGDSLSHRNNHYGHSYAWRDGRGFGGPGERNMHRGGHRHHGRFGHREAHIAYSPEQRKQVQAIEADYHKKSAALFSNDAMTLREYKAQLIGLNKEKKAKLKALLTPEQTNELAKSKARAEENAQVRGAAHLERLKIRLSLNDQQVAALKTQQQNLRSQIHAIRENDNLLPNQKMDQMKDLVAKQKDALKTILTPEQFSQLESMHKHRFGRS
jgi:uncharacterized protein YdcH (DUF465 family)